MRKVYGVQREVNWWWMNKFPLISSLNTVKVGKRYGNFFSGSSTYLLLGIYFNLFTHRGKNKFVTWHSSRTDDVTSTFGSICLNNIFGISRSWWLTWCWVLNPETTPQIQFCRTSTCLPRILATPSLNFIEFARKMTHTAGFVYILTNFCRTKFLSQSQL